MTASQLTDQTAKGGIIGLLSYIAMKLDFDPGLIALVMPLIAGLLAWASTKIGDPTLASFISGQKPSEKDPD